MFAIFFDFLEGGNSGGQSGHDGVQGQRRRALIRQVGHMEKPHPRGAAVEVMQQGVQRVVAHECAGGVGHGGGDLRIPDRLGHVFHRQRGEISRRAIFDDRDSVRLISCVVSEPGVADVDGDPLRRHIAAAGGLSDA